MDDLKKLQDEQLNKKHLKKQWNDSIGCTSTDRWYVMLYIDLLY